MSYFISSIAFDGLRDTPPVSNVMPLPTITMGLDFELAPLYSATINLAGSEAPAVTDNNEPIFNFFISDSFKTLRDIDLFLLAIFLVSLTKNDGVQIFAGRSPKYFTFCIALPMLCPCLRPFDMDELFLAPLVPK